MPTPLDHGCAPALQTPLQSTLPLATIQTAARLTHWICENAKSTRQYLKRVGEIAPLQTQLQDLFLTELPRHMHKQGDHLQLSNSTQKKHTSTNVMVTTTESEIQKWLAPALSGTDMGLTSEAGMPAIADPGSSVVRCAHTLGIQVVTLPGPMSLMLALASSGLNGQQFAFVGYLPQDRTERIQRIQQLDTLVHKTGQTQIAIETPYRNLQLLQSLVNTLHMHTHLSVGFGVTLENHRTHSAAVANWRKNIVLFDELPLDLPAVFCIGL